MVSPTVISSIFHPVGLSTETCSVSPLIEAEPLSLTSSLLGRSSGDEESADAVSPSPLNERLHVTSGGRNLNIFAGSFEVKLHRAFGPPALGLIHNLGEIVVIDDGLLGGLLALPQGAGNVAQRSFLFLRKQKRCG